MLRAENNSFAWGSLLGSVRRRSVLTPLRVAVSTAALGCVLAVRTGYLENWAWLFFGSLGGWLAVGAGWLSVETGRVRSIGWMVWQRAAAVILVFAMIEAGYQLPQWFPATSTAESAVTSSQTFRVITYAEAQGDPHAFAVWWKTYSSEWNRQADLIQTPTPNGPVPYVFRPNTSRPFLNGTVSINSLGLSDREVAKQKGDRFRIVVMGSSHTQCPPVNAGDVPWPAKLEQLIRDRVPGDREIEVLNAGAAAYTLEHNLHRLQEVVLPLQPDMIITYFGYNEFDRFRKDFRLPNAPPKPLPRASVLVGKLDWRVKKWLAKYSSGQEPLENLDALAPRLAGCRLARAYREYLRITQERGIQLVVCNFNMAVDRHSPDEVVRFYERAFPDVRFMIEANRLNSAMLPLVFPPESGARLIDVQPGLNGVWDNQYVDLVHLSEQGKTQLAENVFEKIMDLLPRAGSTPSQPRVVERPDRDTSRF